MVHKLVNCYFIIYSKIVKMFILWVGYGNIHVRDAAVSGREGNELTMCV